MKNYSATYQSILKAVAFLLLITVFVPTGLANQLIDFCNMEMSSHHMTDAPSCHDCCEPEEEEKSSNHHQTHDCEHGVICACNNVQYILDKDYIPTFRDVAVKPVVTANFTPFFTPDEPIRQDLQKRIGQHDSPLYLLYDTFLM